MPLYECYINADCDIEADSPEEAKQQYLDWLSNELEIEDILVKEVLTE